MQEPQPVRLGGVCVYVVMATPTQRHAVRQRIPAPLGAAQPMMDVQRPPHLAFDRVAGVLAGVVVSFEDGFAYLTPRRLLG